STSRLSSSRLPPPPPPPPFPYTTLFRSFPALYRPHQLHYHDLRTLVFQTLLHIIIGIPEWLKAAGQIIGGNPLFLPENSRIDVRSEEHTSELQSRFDLVCRLLLEKKKTN